MSATNSVIVKNPNILGGTPVFRGTRVPLQLLFDSLERGYTLEEFLQGYPTVSRDMAVAALEEAQQLLSSKAHECGFCSMSVSMKDSAITSLCTRLPNRALCWLCRT